jgi:hypothetical protein
MSKHTPGPWRVTSAQPHGAEVSAKSARPLRTTRTVSVAWCGTASSFGKHETQVIDADEAYANACLVAAAPDLLDALEEYHRVANAVPYAQWTPAMHKAQDAIAKVKGEKP